MTLFKRLGGHNTQRTLVFRYNELQQLYLKDRHKKITLILEEFNEINNIWECEEEFHDHVCSNKIPKKKLEINSN